MKPIKGALACLAVSGLVLAQPAAATVRGGSPTQASEHLAGGGLPGAAIPALVAILAVAVVSVISASNDNHHHHPASP